MQYACRSAWMALFVFVFAALFTENAAAQGAPCTFFDTTLRFKDGSLDCPKNFKFLTTRGLIEGDPSSTYRDKIAGRWAIAATENPNLCPFASRIAWDLAGQEAATARSECDRRLADRARIHGVDPKDCRCQVLAESGVSNLTRQAFTDRTETYLQQIAKGNAPVIVRAPPGAAPSPDRAESRPPPQATATQLASRRAFVVGIDRYEQLPELRNGRSDAAAMRAALTSLGFTVDTSIDSNLQTLKSQFAKFVDTVAPGDEVAFFFSGHAFGIDGDNYLAPADLKKDGDIIQTKSDTLGLDAIKRRLQEKNPKIALLVIDACRNDPREPVTRSGTGGSLVPTTAATGQAIIFSAGFNQLALDRLHGRDANPNSVFTRFFVEEIVKPNVPLHQILRTVRQRVVEEVSKVGHKQTPAIYDEIVGDWFPNKR